MRAALIGLLAVPLFAAVEGTVVNQTTGKPQANVIVSVIQPGQGGMQTLGTAKSDAAGKFKIDKPVAEGPAVVQAIHGGVTYSKMAQAAELANVEVPVFDATTKAGTALMDQHMILLQPGESALEVNELFLMRNPGKVTFNDPGNGSIRFTLPPGHGEVNVRVSAPGGMPVQRPTEPAGAENTFKIDYPLKPGETRFDLRYSVSAKEFSGKLMPEGETRLIVPQGVELAGDGIEKLGVVPENQANVYKVTAASYAVKVSGTGTLNLEEKPKAASNSEDTGQPEIKQTMPRIYERLPLVMGLSAAILVLGFVLLFRSRKA